VKVDLEGSCPQRLHWSIYSGAYRNIAGGEADWTGKETVQWNVTDLKGKRVAPGLYYMVFVPEGQKRRIFTLLVQP